MRAYNPAHIGPLVAGTKPNNKYESFEARVHALVLGLRVCVSSTLLSFSLLLLTTFHCRHRRLCVST